MKATSGTRTVSGFFFEQESYVGGNDCPHLPGFDKSFQSNNQVNHDFAMSYATWLRFAERSSEQFAANTLAA